MAGLAGGVAGGEVRRLEGFAARWGDLGLSAAQRVAHIAWDPGALGLARQLAQRLDAVLVHAPVSRLVYDCNRAPDMPGAMPLRSEIHDIPGNAVISAEERAAYAAAAKVRLRGGDARAEVQRVAQALARRGFPSGLSWRIARERVAGAGEGSDPLQPPNGLGEAD